MGGGNCVDGKLDDSNYSSPVPLIGLYVTGATLVCLLFILLDVFAGFRYRKKWLPCRFFSLNSVTLTLLSIAVKLPLDLTSSMPRVQDQLSKITGTSLVCICMGFFMPSLGTCRESECFNNMAALSIFVVTIVANVCIQMYTGAIILFRGELIVVLCCMMVLLMALWCFASEIHSHNEVSHDGIKDNLVKGKGTMLHRLKVSFLLGYNSNPQFTLCRRPLSTFATTLCVLSSFVLMKVAFQSLVSNKKNSDLCEGVSVYKWSMTSIVVSQIITVVIGGLAIAFRLFSLIGHWLGDIGMLRDGFEDADAIIAYNPIFHGGWSFSLIAFAKGVLKVLVLTISLLFSTPFLLLEGCITELVLKDDSCGNNPNNEDEDAMAEFKDLIHDGEMGLDEWTLRKGVDDMKGWIERPKALNQLIKLLSTTTPSYYGESLVHQLKAHYDLVRPGYDVSLLTIVLLVRIANISIPSPLSGTLSSSLNEVFKILHFVDKKTRSSSFENKKKSVLAETLWKRDSFNSLLPKIVKKFGNRGAFQNQSQLDQSTAIIRGLKEVLRRDYVRDELAMLTDFIQLRAYVSIRDLHGYIEQLFVDMMNEFLAQLPNVLLKEIIESNAEECETTVKFASNALCNMKNLEALVQWSFPVGTTITRLISD
ncbi:hypothetical protein Syun_006349 [Stephania yunnanensis]|uniref:Uncharacterized protein n=1 Tax=Stephania yunnanensis TaxID=152371 RepID=A0AAP0KXW0_9MAGN